LDRMVGNLAVAYDVDVFILAECALSPGRLLTTLNGRGTGLYQYVPRVGCEKIEIFARFPHEYLIPLSETDRLTIRRLNLPGLTEVLLAAIHFPSKLRWSAESQAHESVVLAGLIREAEREVGHSRTVLVGDLNMNPFECGVVSAAGLHGVMTRGVAQRGDRIVQGRMYPFFYNPMWGLFGDATPGPPGTYYRAGSEHVEYFWNMFDQVLIRPELLPAFDNRDLKVLESDGEASLLSAAGTPEDSAASDHLPVLFKLRL